MHNISITSGVLGISASQMFKLEGTTGIIRVQGNLDADISTSTVYTFIVKVSVSLDSITSVGFASHCRSFWCKGKKYGKDQESTQSSITPDTGYHMGKWQKTQLKNTRQSQDVRPFPAGDHKAAKNIQEGAQWLSGRVLDSRLRGRRFKPIQRYCVVVLEQDTFIIA